MAISTGRNLLDNLRKALKIPDDVPVRRIVIDVDVHNVVRLFVQGYVDTTAADAICAAVEGETIQRVEGLHIPDPEVALRVLTDPPWAGQRRDD